uniref:Hexosyltransferase n=2 Tax=Chenopodium quinoa TaxID=63459 RepID=A0A803MI08_CHEQI
MSKHAYVTFLAGAQGGYVKGVVGVVKGLRKVKTAYPSLVVAVLPDVPEEDRRLLIAQGCVIREVQPLYPPEGDKKHMDFARAYFVINYAKLRVWEFVEYEKMIFIDADMQVNENIDHLFDLPNGYFYSVLDCFCDPSWGMTPQFKIGYCQHSPEKVEWPTSDLGPPPPLYFNSGFFVFEPNVLTYLDMLNTFQETPPTCFAEQDFLNKYLRDKFKPLPKEYNMVMPMLWWHPDKVELSKVKVMHYCATGSKPWRYTGKEENMDREDVKMLVNKWWDMYNDPSLDYINYSSTQFLTEPVVDYPIKTFV